MLLLTVRASQSIFFKSGKEILGKGMDFFIQQVGLLCEVHKTLCFPVQLG